MEAEKIEPVKPTLAPEYLHNPHSFDCSPQLDKLATAMARMQGHLQNAVKDKTNPHFRSSYADLASCYDACRMHLSQNNLSVIQLPSAEGDKVSVRSILLHTSGQYISHCLTVKARDAGPQAVGSAITYVRRYSLCSVVGIAPDDDDGNAATPEPRQQQQRPSPPPPSNKNPVFNPKIKAQADWLANTLMQHPATADKSELWDEINHKMIGRPGSDLETVIKSVVGAAKTS